MVSDRHHPTVVIPAHSQEVRTVTLVFSLPNWSKQGPFPPPVRLAPRKPWHQRCRTLLRLFLEALPHFLHRHPPCRSWLRALASHGSPQKVCPTTLQRMQAPARYCRRLRASGAHHEGARERRSLEPSESVIVQKQWYNHCPIGSATLLSRVDLLSPVATGDVWSPRVGGGG